MGDNVRPKGFDDSDLLEEDTSRVIDNCFRYDQVRVNFETIDKYPNRDGFIELLDEELVPVGDLVIQVKKLPDDAVNPPKKQVSCRTLAYGYITNSPFVLLGVDTENEVVYWKYARGEWLDDLELGKADTRVVRFPEDNRITGGDESELSRLMQIAEDESEYLDALDETQLIEDTIRFIYELKCDSPFQGAGLRRDIANTSWERETGVTLTPGFLDTLVEKTDYIRKLPIGGDAVAIVDRNASATEKAVANINDIEAVQEIVFRAVARDADEKLTEHPIDWNSPAHILAAVNSIAGPALDSAIHSRYYQLTEDGVALATAK